MQTAKDYVLRDRVLDYIAGHTTFNLATTGPAGLWSAAVLYVHEGTQLYFTSVAATRHAQNFVATGACAGTINDDCTSIDTMRGVQLEGHVELVTDLDERRRVARAYLARFPFCAGLWHGETDADVIAKDPGVHGFYRVTPTRLLFTDNEPTPVSRGELPLE